ncbi:hypothetical protein ACNJYD_09075 [Bradyrhizobium sp. DASA03005]|uniref:hypothetical protein n=1 Tax=Bradyrhizobium sp. SPXBL-02 TaxID=3395912 RepID=UPI003F725AB0
MLPLFRQDLPSPCQKAGELEEAQPFHSPLWAMSYSALPFGKEDEALLEAFNKALSEFVGTAEHTRRLVEAMKSCLET